MRLPDNVTMKHLYYFAIEHPEEQDRWEMLVGEGQWILVSQFLARKARVHIRDAPSGLPLVVRPVA